MAFKKRLFTPGPTPIPERVLDAMRVSGLHHRTPEFQSLLQRTATAYANLVDSPTTPVFLSGSGTAAMDAALSQCVAADETLCVLHAGKFGERWVQIANTRSLTVAEYSRPWGSSIEEDSFRRFIKEHAAAAALCMQYCETSTAVLHPLDSIQKIMHEEAPDMLLIVDGITAVGTCDISMQASGIDVLLCGSQKALMLPPGLAMVTASERAWKKMESTPSTQYYLDLVKERRSQEQGSTAFTPAIAIIAGLDAVLNMMHEEGLPAVYLRHQQMRDIFRTTLSAFGFSLTGDDGYAPPGVTLAQSTDTRNADQLRKDLLEETGIRCAGGQDSFKGKVIRFGHMGYHDVLDSCGVLYAVARCLKKQGIPDSDLEEGLSVLASSYLSLS